MLQDQLNDREKNVLRYVIQQFILTASPVGSRNITRKYDLGISPATVRNIMSDLEESGFINHPHTSAGRVPTDKGYRFYVDSLMSIQKLRSKEKGLIENSLGSESTETSEMVRLAGKLLSSITKQLACVSYPNLDSGIFEKLQIVNISSTRIMIVISIKSGLVKTITLELDSNIKESQLESVQTLLNEKLNGLTFKDIRDTFSERFNDVDEDQRPVIRLFIDSVDKIFKDEIKSDRVIITGAKNIIQHPEFENPENFQSVIEMIEDKDIIVHIMEKSGGNLPDEIYISIGSENEEKKLQEYSFISKEYKFGETHGTLGIIGPKRMEYSKIVAIVDFMAKMLSEYLTNPIK
jgi:heat-inducible transcriptional repressor